MSLTLSRVPDGEDIWGRTRTTLFDVACDTSYPLTNGYTINAADVGLKFFKSARVEGANKAAGAILPMLDFGTFVAGSAALPSAVALRLFNPTGGATAPSTLTAPVVAVTEGAVTIGGTATGTIPSGGTTVTSTSASPAVSVPATGLTGTIAAGSGTLTGGIAKEVANATNVSTLSFRIRFFG